MDRTGVDSNGQRFLSVADVAGRTSLSTRSIRRYIDAGALPARKAGSRILIREADLEIWFSGLEPCGTTSEPLTTTSTSNTAHGYRW